MTNEFQPEDGGYIGVARNKHNGVMPLTFARGWPWQTTVHVYGGPYDNFPGTKDFFGVCVRAERAEHAPKALWLPIRDFETPDSAITTDAVLVETLVHLLNGGGDHRPVWVGCAGGYGRTGLFLALLAKAAGVSDPVNYVKTRYHSHAVETDEQQAYVEGLDIAPYASFATWECFKGWLKRALVFWR